MASKMIVEVWSDVMCPFCYIGKRKFEVALSSFSNNEHIELEWKSYQLDPGMKTDPSIKYYESLASSKGMPVEQAKAMCDQVTEMAKEVGLKYDFEKAVVANSFHSHELSHFAKQFDKQNQVEELLFKAFFEEGKNIDDLEVLKSIVLEVGLDVSAFQDSMEKGEFKEAVNQDINEAKEIGVRGVPFFVFNRKYAISGAQPVDVFKQTIEKSFNEWKSENNKVNFEVIDGPSCGPDGCN
ncbi:DsbA family oxidoreductase [Sphingobacterium sp. UT-1RO-CII-1]|uniref:DsbA family oxidoreductase n=1 Tax=Sphingobacterium sp. UT-1RO-CII-1 TaxID=2995225 RepID=UPI00227B8CBA|nr:DsbA family oxidoreductase [Sphingobacterium sp. UT-1RO-CII-1]